MVSRDPWGETAARRILDAPCAVEDENPPMTHDRRLRQFPTNQYHASLRAPGRVIREYQVDSPSINASLQGSGYRALPRWPDQDVYLGVTGSSISGCVVASSIGCSAGGALVPPESTEPG